MRSLRRSLGNFEAHYSVASVADLTGIFARCNLTDELPNRSLVAVHPLVSISELRVAMEGVHEQFGDGIHRPPLIQIVRDDNWLVNRNQHVIALTLKIFDDFSRISKTNEARRGGLLKNIILENSP